MKIKVKWKTNENFPKNEEYLKKGKKMFENYRTIEKKI